MRREGDILLDLVGRAEKKVLLCAPFIKQGVMGKLLQVISPSVELDVVTRWHPKEIAGGVSDLEVFDLISKRPRSTLRLLDDLHAKVYMGDGAYLAGSANLTAKALGWCRNANVELLTNLPADDVALGRCLVSLGAARPATEEERSRVRDEAARLQVPDLDVDEPMEDTPVSVWLPRMAAPEKLHAAYYPALRERLTSSVIEAADSDLRALGLSAGLNEQQFRSEVAYRFSTMPSISSILEAARDDLTDDAGSELVERLAPANDMPARVQWAIVREWLTHFLPDSYEIAPQSFVTRLRPGAGR